MSPVIAWKLPPGDCELQPVHLEAETLDEATRQLPSGAYTTFRTYGKTRALRLAGHFARLEETARLALRPIPVDRERLRAALRTAIKRYPASENRARELRIRIILDLAQTAGSVYLLLDALHVPSAEDYRCGVKAVTRVLHRENPKAKLTSFIESADAVRVQLPAGINEALMVAENGRMLEGLSSNFFAVREGVIWTAEQGVLSGITRSVVLDLIAALRIPLKLEGIQKQDPVKIQEAFITSASRAVLPVTTIDGKPVGTGKPGPLTRRLMKAYERKINQELEEI